MRARRKANSELDIRDFIDGQSVFYAGTANSILQLGWPGVGYGVYESKVDDGSVMKVPRKRFRTTVTYLSVAMLGTDEELERGRNELEDQNERASHGERLEPIAQLPQHLR